MDRERLSIFGREGRSIALHIHPPVVLGKEASNLTAANPHKDDDDAGELIDVNNLRSNDTRPLKLCLPIKRAESQLCTCSQQIS